jgi:hypothetical protein
MNKFIAKAMLANNKIGCDTVQLDPRGMDEAIVGTRKKGKKTHLVYSYRRLVEYFRKDMPEDDAVEWIEYNTVRALPYMCGPKLVEPIIRRERGW